MSTPMSTMDSGASLTRERQVEQFHDQTQIAESIAQM